MATSVYSTEEIQLSDGTTVILRPLPVKYLRLVLKKFGEYTKGITKAIEQEKGEDFDPDGLKLIDNLLECSKIALNAFKVEIAEPEEVLDIETIYKILYVTADINLKDAGANLQQQAVTAANNGLGLA